MYARIYSFRLKLVFFKDKKKYSIELRNWFLFSEFVIQHAVNWITSKKKTHKKYRKNCVSLRLADLYVCSNTRASKHRNQLIHITRAINRITEMQIHKNPEWLSQNLYYPHSITAFISKFQLKFPEYLFILDKVHWTSTYTHTHSMYEQKKTKQIHTLQSIFSDSMSVALYISYVYGIYAYERCKIWQKYYDGRQYANFKMSHTLHQNTGDGYL